MCIRDRATPANFNMNNHRAKKHLPVKLAGFALGLMTLAVSAQTAATFGDLPLYFEADSPTRFHAQGRDLQFSISPDGAQLVLRGHADAAARAVQMQFIGKSPRAQIHGDTELPGKINYFTGNNPAQWHSGLPTFAKVRVEEIYPGINLDYYGNQQQIEYDLTVAAGTKPDSIELHFDGADEIKTLSLIHI